MRDIVIKATNVSKKFIKKNGEENEVLKNVSFELKKGDVLGIIGENGAGKSTFLKVLSGSVKPTSRSVFIKGKIVVINELGVGFHPDLTGLENIELFLKINGSNLFSINKLVLEIIEFAELANYINEH